jgi:1-deoxy-D-xylulose 5-phosphate reductoisomerase
LSVKQIAVLGATGSIGRQALDIIDTNDELEACALASGSSELETLAAESATPRSAVT